MMLGGRFRPGRPFPGRARRAVCALPVLLIVVAAPVAAGTLSARNSRIVEVTVFPDRAEIVREARVDLPAGASTVEFPDLPWRVEPDSLRVSAKGVAATLGAVELKEKADEPKESPEFLAAREEVRRLMLEINMVKSADQTASEMREFLKALRATTAAREAEKLGEGRADPNGVFGMYALILRQMGALDEERVARSDRLERLAEQMKVAQARLNAARPAGAIRTKSAAVEVESKQAGALTLRLAYVAPAASWRPAYRASIDAATGEVSLGSEAVVTQSTGEDWSGVTLRLSTAAPARGVDPPEMTSLLLRPLEYIAQNEMLKGAAGGVMARAPAAAEADVMSMEAKVSGSREGGFVDIVPDEEAAAQQAGVVHSAYNVAFEVPGKSEVPADGSEHRVVLRQETLAGKVEYRTVPAINAAAYMVAKTQAPEGYPLLAGPVRVFAGGAYLGAFPLEETAPKAEVTLPFGIDNRIAVERTPLPQAREQTGIFGKEKRIGYAFRTTVENLRDQKATVVLEDRIPVSEDERIQVEMGKGTTPGSKDLRDRPGILEWSLDLAPRGKLEVILEYTVRFPRDLYVPGIE